MRVPHGVANVAYAGSLEYLNERMVGPAFQRATGDRYEGRGGGSFGLANEIAAGEITPSVFESIGAAPILRLEPRFTHWYVAFASSPLVIAYNPHTAFAARFAALARARGTLAASQLAQLLALLESPGLQLGRTNPNTDPQGQAFYEMIELAAQQLHAPTDTATKLLGAADNPAQVFSETSLEARLEAGQLDAASAFRSQAIQLHLPYVALPASIDFGSPSLSARYARASLKLSDGQVVHGVPLVVDATEIGSRGGTAARAFLSWVLSAHGRAEFRAGGYTTFNPIFVGSGVPRSVRDAAS
jgi:molybdate/tungstate transport system substrate-binding protein